MKQKLSLALALALTLSLAACGNQAGDRSTPPAATAPSTPPAGSAGTSEPSENTGTPDTVPAPADGEANGILIAYFGVPETDGTDTVANASRVATEDGVVGNCQFIAQAIQQAVGGNLFAIETVQQYPGSHQPLLDFAYDELRQNARPELSSELENLEDYSVIFLGYLSLTAYGENAEAALEQAQNRIRTLERLWSVTEEHSEIYAANHSGGNPVPISKDTADLVRYALDMAERTEGALEPTLYPVLTAWGFTTDSFQIPEREELDHLLERRTQ